MLWNPQTFYFEQGRIPTVVGQILLDMFTKKSLKLKREPGWLLPPNSIPVLQYGSGRKICGIISLAAYHMYVNRCL